MCVDVCKINKGVVVKMSKREMSHNQKWLSEKKEREGLHECALAWISAAAQSSTENKPTHLFSCVSLCVVLFIYWNRLLKFCSVGTSLGLTYLENDRVPNTVCISITWHFQHVLAKVHAVLNSWNTHVFTCTYFYIWNLEVNKNVNYILICSMHMNIYLYIFFSIGV